MRGVPFVCWCRQQWCLALLLLTGFVTAIISFWVSLSSSSIKRNVETNRRTYPKKEKRRNESSYIPQEREMSKRIVVHTQKKEIVRVRKIPQERELRRTEIVVTPRKEKKRKKERTRIASEVRNVVQNYDNDRDNPRNKEKFRKVRKVRKVRRFGKFVKSGKFEGSESSKSS